VPVHLPHRSDGSSRPAGLVLPPDRMALWRGRRPLKRWRYVGVYGPDVMLCAASVRIGGVPQGFWAVWDRGARELHERTVFRPGAVSAPDGALRAAGIDLALEPAGEAVEIVSAHGAQYIWTRKQPVRARGTVDTGARRVEVDAHGLVDDSAGYHARSTRWAWSAGVGSDGGGRAIAWNLVDGVHDGASDSERTVWVDGVASEVGPAAFADDLGSVTFADGSLSFTEEAVRARRDNLVLFSSDYRQPFGTFTGTLPGGVRLAEGFGVMERHDVRW
jgi:hypothetical protein